MRSCLSTPLLAALSAPAECCFFAEDVFGCQFALVHGGVSVFDPETGDFKWLADDLNGWGAEILENWRVLTGHPLGHDWQAANGPLRPGRRLQPKVPFVLGGEFVLSNLYDADAAQGMRARGDLAAQLGDLPAGSKVRLRMVE